MKDYLKIENGISKVPMICSDCGETAWIPQSTWERYYADEEEFICADCQRIIISVRVENVNPNLGYGQNGDMIYI
jgi:hypothetical protein